MTEASIQALSGIRDLTTLKWYVISLLAIVFYIYTAEIQKARKTGNWNAVFAGLTIFGMDFINETWNGWVLHFTGRSAMWTAPGDTALRTLVGWNIEIMFMFAISGLIFYNTLSEDRKEKILGIPNQWFWAIGYAIFCVFVEWFLNKGGHLVWEYPFWNRSFKGVWLIFLFGYFHFYVAAILVINMKHIRTKLITIGTLYTIAILANIFGLGIMKWQY
ncbi:MAG: hypothetical protein KKE62_19485 [Proteobacteria bacterium]|nr:hypothetical protein [Pseudomonadota bacterium]MBU1390026.1 hypothetical protein [Pseudomonadota bacterium]MBU1545023.1 hypothetical protein [Pseudomonadota bacterium]MBU2430334.1 hypothetical protein [Pseudomonadota bacterium]MBU2480373.1 hypothetical protein [Pseudomonadota bacterium]